MELAPIHPIELVEQVVLRPIDGEVVAVVRGDDADRDDHLRGIGRRGSSACRTTRVPSSTRRAPPARSRDRPGTTPATPSPRPRARRGRCGGVRRWNTRRLSPSPAHARAPLVPPTESARARRGRAGAGGAARSSTPGPPGRGRRSCLRAGRSPPAPSASCSRSSASRGVRSTRARWPSRGPARSCCSSRPPLRTPCGRFAGAWRRSRRWRPSSGVRGAGNAAVRTRLQSRSWRQP